MTTEQPQQHAPDWEIGDLYNKAFKIAKEYKVLWIFGMAAGGAGFSNLNFNGGSNSFTEKDIQEFQNLFNTKESMTSFPDVLGASTSKGWDMVVQILASVPPWMYGLLAIEIFALTVFVVVVGLIYNAWAQAALLESVETSITGQKPTMRESCEKAFRSIKSLIWLMTIPMLVVMLSTLVAAAILITAMIAGPTAVKIIAGILLVVGLIAFVILLIFLALAQIWAPRIVVTEHVSAKESLMRGLKIARKKRGASILLGFVNTVVSGIVYGVPLAILIGLFLGGMFGFMFDQTVGVFLLALSGLLFIVFIFGSILLGGILNAFKTTVWSLAYRNIKGKYDK